MFTISTDWGKGLVDTLVVYPSESVWDSNRVPIKMTRKHLGDAAGVAILLLTKEQVEELIAELTVRLGELK